MDKTPISMECVGSKVLVPEGSKSVCVHTGGQEHTRISMMAGAIMAGA